MIKDKSCATKCIILPCAGGCAANYNKYKHFLPDVTIYEYPGHWTRYREGLVHSVSALVEDFVTRVIDAEQDMPLYLFGHSMGGIVAWSAVEKLLSMGVTVAGLYIAACSPPSESGDFLREIKNDNDIKLFLAKIRQVPSKVLESAFFRENLLPSIKNDFQMIQNLSDGCIWSERKINIPITCFYGQDDSLVPYSNIQKWKEFTEKETRFFACRGNHFFVYDTTNANYISNIISEGFK